MSCNDDENEDVEVLRAALADLLACVEATPAAKDVGTDTWTAVHRARLAMQRTEQ